MMSAADLPFSVAASGSPAALNAATVDGWVSIDGGGDLWLVADGGVDAWLTQDAESVVDQANVGISGALSAVGLQTALVVGVVCAVGAGSSVVISPLPARVEIAGDSGAWLVTDDGADSWLVTDAGTDTWLQTV